MASITSTWRTKLSPPHKFTFRGLANLYLAGALLPTTVYNTTSNCIHKLSHNILHVRMLLSRRPCFTKSQQASIEGPHKWGCRNFEFQHQVFFKCSKNQHKLGGLGVLCSKPYRKMHTDVRFSTSFLQMQQNTKQTWWVGHIVFKTTYEMHSAVHCPVCFEHKSSNPPSLHCVLLHLKSAWC